MPTIDFTDRVAIITGAGRGIGRAYAELLAHRGARVVINDKGVSMDGAGVDSGPAHEVAAALNELGCAAVADTSDIVTPDGAAHLVNTAISSFGRLDIVVNNAGIFTMDAFPDMDLDAMRAHFDVHIGGSFNVTRAAWPHMVERGYGRVVMTTSTGALGIDNLVAYGTAKAGVMGMGRALSDVGKAHGIKVNMIAPQAMTRMMAAGFGDHAAAIADDPQRNPALVAPMAAILCHERCPTTGITYLGGMRRNAMISISETAGYVHPHLELTPEQLEESWNHVIDDRGAVTVTGTMAEAAFHTALLDEQPVR